MSVWTEEKPCSSALVIDAGDDTISDDVYALLILRRVKDNVDGVMKMMEEVCWIFLLGDAQLA